MSENTENKTVAIPLITENEEALRDVKSFDDAIQLLMDAGITPVTTTDLGDGFVILDDKDKLVKVLFVILGMKFSESKTYKDEQGNPAQFVVMHIVTEHNQKWIITDGSTGIKNQALKYANAGRLGGIICEKGLIRSDFEETEDRPAGTTYYLS